MKINAAMVRVDRLRPNAIDQEQKVAWIMELEGKLAETMGVTPPVQKWPEADMELLMPAPYDNIYELYLCAMIDAANMETALYENDYTIFNAAWNEARAWWRRTHTPAYTGNWKVM